MSACTFPKCCRGTGIDGCEGPCRAGAAPEAVREVLSKGERLRALLGRQLRRPRGIGPQHKDDTTGAS